MHNTHNITHSQKINQCIISGGPVSKILDFGQHAYADTFIGDDQLNLSEPVFPLQVYLNPESGSIQLGYISHAEDRYNLYSYSYTSSNSNIAKAHWNEYADTVQSQYPSTGLVVEIGSNDGYLLQQFQKTGNKCLGIDSSGEMCEIALKNGVSSIHGMFNEMLADQIKLDYGSAQTIMANNVFNHANDPVAFARGIERLLDDNGIFIFETPYWLSMIESGRFTDMVYHEHPSYFTIKSVWNILSLAGLQIIDYEIVDYHGGSIRVVAKKLTDGVMPIKVEDAIAKESQIGLFTIDFYLNLQRRFIQQRDNWLEKFYQLRREDPNAVFIGVGAAAKANTWLTWHGINATHLHCITDASEHKQGKYTPLSRIPILDDDEFAKHKNPYALILSWNIGEGLKKALSSINPNTRFISQ